MQHLKGFDPKTITAAEKVTSPISDKLWESELVVLNAILKDTQASPLEKAHAIKNCMSRFLDTSYAYANPLQYERDRWGMGAGGYQPMRASGYVEGGMGMRGMPIQQVPAANNTQVSVNENDHISFQTLNEQLTSIIVTSAGKDFMIAPVGVLNDEENNDGVGIALIFPVTEQQLDDSWKDTLFNETLKFLGEDTNKYDYAMRKTTIADIEYSVLSIALTNTDDMVEVDNFNDIIIGKFSNKTFADKLA